ncbi:long-chain fatty acid--CoA ligase [Intrasporangium chromatireducens Q5-1]|uniref:Long-chain fatty acid--CoA ligase n=1 Tax=Intrasporangium chromatireducens Q5-1 TaxID=584657 RepID=W9GGW5_9MICO|nr:AMP-binding protein [Intrasporangium chromatireducens]EWT05325.1 long-chain fatty acid--CoA ligase [Intrasporangium chromatireducens Q5-1]
MDVAELIRRAALEFGDAPALRTSTTVMSFLEFDEQTERIGNGLLAQGLERGDRVGVLLPNGVDVVLVYYALAKSGLVRVPLNIKDTEGDHRYKLGDSGAQVLITDLPGFETTTRVVTCADLHEFASSASAEPGDHRWRADELYRIGYTGGTTGRPKGVLLTHGIEMALLRNYLIDLLPGLQPGDRMLHAAPMTHATGSFFLPHLVRGGCNIIMESFDADRLVQFIGDVNPTCMFLVPTMISMLVDHPRAEAGMTPSLRRLCYGASPIAPSVAQKAIGLFGPVLTQTYGQSEAPMTITLLRPEDHDRVGCAGRPYTFVDVQVHNEAGQQVQAGQEGEVVVRGDIVTPGYHQRPDATAETLRDGWLHTGDIGRFDDHGYLYLLDRKNDLIISGGYNVYPREVEDVLMSHPAVLEAAVYGLPDERWGQLVHAAVALAAGADVSSDDLIAYCRDRLPSSKRPRHVSCLPSLPKSPAGKILRREVASSLSRSLGN